MYAKRQRCPHFEFFISSLYHVEGQERTFSLDCLQSYDYKNVIHPLAEIPGPELFLGPRPARPPNSGQIIHSKNPCTCWSTRTDGTSASLRWCHNRTNMEKSSYCCCYSRGRFNTGERNFHLSAAHSCSRTEQHMAPPRASCCRTSCTRRGSLQMLRARRQVTAERLRYSDQMWSRVRYSRNLRCLSSIIWHRSSKKVTHREETGAEEGGLVTKSTLWIYRTTQCVEKEQYGHRDTWRIHLTSIKSSLLTSTRAKQLERLHLHDYLLLLSTAKLCVLNVRGTV